MRRGLAVVMCALGLGGTALATSDTGNRELRGAIHESARSMQSMRLTGDVDHDFVAAMQQHHHDGLELARVQLLHGKDPTARALARQLIEEQKRDLDTLERWMWERQIADKAK